MEFDKSRVYTALNADELKVGSKIIVGDCMEDLIGDVKENSPIYILASVNPPSYNFRFRLEDNTYWNLAYLISEPKEKRLKWSDTCVK